MDTDGDRLWILIAFLIVCCLLRAWFSACEAALTEANDARIKTLAEEDRRWQKLDRLLTVPSRLLLCFTTHRVLSAVWISMLTFGIFGSRLAGRIPVRESGLLAGIILSLIAAIVLIAFTDLLPKRLASRQPEKFARFASGSVQMLMLCLAPLIWLVRSCVALICLPFGIKASETTEIVTEEEIRMLVDAGNETGVIEESQRDMINNIFAFDDVMVSEVMTHRKDMSAVPKDETVFGVAAVIREEGFSRVPVYDGTVDTIVGVVLVKDLLSMMGEAEDHPILPLMRDVVFVPESAKCRDVFQRMRREKIQLAIVSDEYGGTAGMVTMEDLLEEIVGNIQDEYDDEEAELTELSEGVFSIDGAADPEDILPTLGVKAECGEDFDTMSAYVVHLLGRIPTSGETPSVVHEGVRYTLLEYEDNWISRICAEKLTVENMTDSEESE
ncbi:MAG: HlyC/CorC family transporter [Oscillospiraceae bacterium]|nr:HlyC/CorC family transporter [Oscillospiraceae bacterium]